MKIVAYNPETKDLEKSYLGKSYASGVTSLLLKNTDRFADGQKILIGEMGRERSEIVEISGAPTATTIGLVAGTQFPHDADDPVYVLDYDQVRIYRSTTGQAGAYSLLDTVDMDVDNADNGTFYDDANALTTYWYELAYYDSVNDTESEHTAPIGATGYTRKQLGHLIPKVAKDVKDPDFIEVDIDQWISWANDISDDLITQAKRPYRFLKKSETIDVSADDYSFGMPADFWKINFIQVHEFGAASERIWRPRQFASVTSAQYQLNLYTLGADYVDGLAVDDEAEEVLFYPKARVDRIGAFTLHYYKTFDEFTSLADTVETPNTLVYKLGLKREYYMLKADDDSKYLPKAKEYDQKYNAEVMKLQREKNIFADGPTGMAPDRKRYPQWGGRRYRQ